MVHIRGKKNFLCRMPPLCFSLLNCLIPVSLTHNFLGKMLELSVLPLQNHCTGERPNKKEETIGGGAERLECRRHLVTKQLRMSRIFLSVYTPILPYFMQEEVKFFCLHRGSGGFCNFLCTIESHKLPIKCCNFLFLHRTWPFLPLKKICHFCPLK